MGVAFGSMLGTLTVGFAASMNAVVGWDFAVLIFLLLYFFFEVIALFVYFASPTYFYVGLMFSCFYAENALTSFKGVDTLGRSNYQNILSQLVAILVATLMDVITDRSLSLRATAKLKRFVAVVDEAVQHFPVSSRAEVLELRQEGVMPWNRI